MYSKALTYFKKHDPLLHAAALEFEIENVKRSDDLFRDIVWTIIGQQLSGKAADTIFDRFIKLCPGGILTPKQVEKLTYVDFRGCGLSEAKTRAIRELSRQVLAGELDLDRLPSLSDADVIAELTKVKGIGPWTAEMILMFSLGKTDVFSLGDLGLRKGLMYLHGWKKLPSEKKLLATIQKWSPYRTYAARILWKIADKQRARIPRKR